jgi:hypothetical protein
MFRKICFFVLAVAGVSVAVLGCEDTVTPQSSKSPSSILDQTPRADGEAEAVALWLSGELVAPQSTYEKVHNGLDAVRRDFGDSIPALTRTYFVAPWVPGELLLILTEDAWAALRRGEYHDLDSLNAYYRATKVDTSLIPSFRLMIVQFEGRLHPERLAEAYAKVPSLERADPNGQWNNTSDVYPWLAGDGMTFLFREGWGDCPSGCIYNQFWYFRVNGENAEYVGTFVAREDPVPPWWEEAKTAFDAKRGG